MGVFDERLYIMDWYRLKHSVAMTLIYDTQKRADYIKSHNLFYHMGNNCMVMFRKLPLYSKLISFQDNVWIASNVTFITHDVIHRMLNNKFNTKRFTENIGCIDIRENVFIGANTIILPNVKIGPNTIVGAGSLVNKDLSEGVYAGIPCRYICGLEEFISKKRKIVIEFEKNRLSEKTIEECWERFKNMKNYEKK